MGLKKWTAKTTRARGHREGELSETVMVGEEEDPDSLQEMWDLEEEEDIDGSGPGELTFRMAYAKDGELVIEYEGEDDDRGEDGI
jgi:hypothetical protein